MVKQVRDSDEPEHRPLAAASDPVGATTALSSPNLASLPEPQDGPPEEDKMNELAVGLSGSFKQQAFKNSKGKAFWNGFSEPSSKPSAGAATPPSRPPLLPRDSSSGVSEDAQSDSALPWNLVIIIPLSFLALRKLTQLGVKRVLLCQPQRSRNHPKN